MLHLNASALLRFAQIFSSPIPAVEKLMFLCPRVKARWPLAVVEEGTSSDLLRGLHVEKTFSSIF